MTTISRNSALGFAHRTCQNLEYIEKAYEKKEDVRVITHLANSLLGLIVFPIGEENFLNHIKTLRLDALEKKGWPKFRIIQGEKPTTLWHLVRHLRNAVGHGHMTFSSDSPSINEVEIIVEDHYPDDPKPYWRARFNASDLRAFCKLFVDLLDDTIG